MNAIPAPPLRPAGQMARRQLLACFIGAGVAVAVPRAASAATVSYYGRGYQAGGYR
jgi:hypothetical protein